MPLRSISRRAVAVSAPARRRTRRLRRAARTESPTQKSADLRPARISARNISPRNLTVPLQIVSAEIHRLALNEVLHRIGRDQAAVVSFGVGLPERVAVQEEEHVRAKHRACRRGGPAVAIQAIRDDVALAVVVTLRAGDKSCSRLHRVFQSEARDAEHLSQRFLMFDIARRGQPALQRIEHIVPSCCPSRRTRTGTRTVSRYAAFRCCTRSNSSRVQRIKPGARPARVPTRPTSSRVCRDQDAHAKARPAALRAPPPRPPSSRGAMRRAWQTAASPTRARRPTATLRRSTRARQRSRRDRSLVQLCQCHWWIAAVEHDVPFNTHFAHALRARQRKQRRERLPGIVRRVARRHRERCRPAAADTRNPPPCPV